MNSTLQSFACSATAPALLSHKDVANVENAGAVFYLPPASLQSFAVNLINLLPLTFIIYSTYLTGKLPVNFP